MAEGRSSSGQKNVAKGCDKNMQKKDVVAERILIKVLWARFKWDAEIGMPEVLQTGGALPNTHLLILVLIIFEYIFHTCLARRGAGAGQKREYYKCF
jgi:hypothetical protein